MSAWTTYSAAGAVVVGGERVTLVWERRHDARRNGGVHVDVSVAADGTQSYAVGA